MIERAIRHVVMNAKTAKHAKAHFLCGLGGLCVHPRRATGTGCDSLVWRLTVGKATLMAVAVAVAMAQPQGEQELMARARAIHERVITLDTHNDIDPENFTRGCN